MSCSAHVRSAACSLPLTTVSIAPLTSSQVLCNDSPAPPKLSQQELCDDGLQLRIVVDKLTSALPITA